jgi:hypothetical protein
MPSKPTPLPSANAKRVSPVPVPRYAPETRVSASLKTLLSTAEECGPFIPWPPSSSPRSGPTADMAATVGIRRTADAQLPVAVLAPALDPAPAYNRARVFKSKGDGDGGKAWQEMIV